MALRDIVNKAKTLARKNPAATRKVIDAVQDQVDRRTRGKYRGQVDKAGDAIEGQLGVRPTQRPDADPPNPPNPR